MTAGSIAARGGEWKGLGRIALLSLAAHVSLGCVIATRDPVSYLSPGVWGIEDSKPLSIRLSEELPAPLERFRPLPPRTEEARASRNPGRLNEEEPAPPPKGRRSGGGGGDPLARVTQAGVLGHLSGSDGGTRVSSIEGGTVHASDGIAQLLRGVGATRKATGLSARGTPGIGFGEGVGSGFGGGVATMRAEELVASFGDGGGREIVLERRGALAGGGGLPYLEGGGCREEAEIARVVQGHRGGVRGCYNRSLLKNPEQEGEIGVRFVIDAGGRVVSAEILSRTFHDPEMEACVLERMRDWTFSHEEGCETIVRYSFHFSAGP
ncbi:MAG: AgmX/PglI C-terminal domain-containing protein [Candidatus Eisenbacteria bacterium]